MKKEEIYMELFDISRATYFTKKKEKNPAYELINHFFSDKNLEEYLETGKIKEIEWQKYEKKVDEIEDFILSTAVHKIINKSIPSIWKKEVLPKKLFIKVLLACKKTNKQDFINQIANTKVNIIESQNYKKIIINFVEFELSKIEVEQIIINKQKVIEALA